jgi:hypothetical protein
MLLKLDPHPSWMTMRDCPICGSPPGVRCRTPSGRRRETPHDERPFSIPGPAEWLAMVAEHASRPHTATRQGST